MRPNGTLAHAEKEYIRQILAQCEGDVQRTAGILGISRKNLWQNKRSTGCWTSEVSPPAVTPTVTEW